MTITAEAPSTGTAKFARRRAQILDEASAQINEFGARGMTLTAVARALGLDTSSVTYYFKRKDQLAAACFERTLRWLEERVRLAAEESTPEQRVRRLLAAHVELHRLHRAPDGHRLAYLGDMRALEPGTREPLDRLYRDIFTVARRFFAPDDPTDQDRPRTGTATLVLLTMTGWLSHWLDRYLERDLARVEARLSAMCEHGLAPTRPWRIDVTPLEDGNGGVDAQTRFLHAATNLINREGYIGASVEKIAAELGVSTGSFYHHLENKDDLVVACFERSFDLFERAERLSDRAGDSYGERLGAMITMLVALQFSGESPLLRNGAFQALPPALRAEMLEGTSQVTEQIAGMVADGVADGSLRPVDPMIAAQSILSAIHAAADLRDWAARRPLADAVAAHVRVLQHGLF